VSSIRTWRITKTRYAAQAFDGKGARLAGGRWNSPGTPLVYTSSSGSLATLEILVHLGNSSILGSYSLIWCEFDASLVRPLDRSLLPKRWRISPPPPETQALGDRWVGDGISAVLAVP
jgi:RES domain-containing protein